MRDQTHRCCGRYSANARPISALRGGICAFKTTCAVRRRWYSACARSVLSRRYPRQRGRSQRRRAQLPASCSTLVLLDSLASLHESSNKHQSPPTELCALVSATHPYRRAPQELARNDVTAADACSGLRGRSKSGDGWAVRGERDIFGAASGGVK